MQATHEVVNHSEKQRLLLIMLVELDLLDHGRDNRGCREVLELNLLNLGVNCVPFGGLKFVQLLKQR